MNFGERLLALRRAAGLTQAQLAKKAGVSQNSVSTLETGEREPAWNTVVALSRALGVSCEAFTVEPDTTEPKPPAEPAADGKPPARKPKK